MASLVNDFTEALRRGKGRFVMMCGAGVSMGISDDMRNWAGFVSQYVAKTAEVMGLNATWTAHVTALGMMEQIAQVENILNVDWNAAFSLFERHRMVAQLLLQNPVITHPNRGLILHRLKHLILTTNYDTVIEDSVPHLRISISHIEAENHFPGGMFTDGEIIGPGPMFGNPLEQFVIHVHGRYFDIGPEHGFCFTPDEYENPVMLGPFINFMTKVVTTKSLVFIGAKGTVEDVHFLALWDKVRETSKRHYLLHNAAETEQMNQLAARILQGYQVTLVPIIYGDTNDDLWPFLEQCSALF